MSEHKNKGKLPKRLVCGQWETQGIIPWWYWTIRPVITEEKVSFSPALALLMSMSMFGR